jgi:hypothetical protein
MKYNIISAITSAADRSNPINNGTKIAEPNIMKKC